MNKRTILFVFESKIQAKIYFEDTIMPSLGEVKKKEQFFYEYNGNRYLFFSFNDINESLRGYNVDACYVCSDIKLSQFEELKLNIGTDNIVLVDID